MRKLERSWTVKWNPITKASGLAKEEGKFYNRRRTRGLGGARVKGLGRQIHPLCRERGRHGSKQMGGTVIKERVEQNCVTGHDARAEKS